MVSINKIASSPVVSEQAKVLKNTVKKAAPIATGGLAVLAGASMGPVLPPHDVFSVPGSSVTDPLIDQLGYTGQKIIDLGSEIVDGITQFGKSAIDGIVTVGSAIFDGLSSPGDVVTDGAADLSDQVIDGVSKLAEHIINSLG